MHHHAYCTEKNHRNLKTKKNTLRFDDFFCYFCDGCTDHRRVNTINIMLNKNHEILEIRMIVKVEYVMQFEK